MNFYEYLKKIIRILESENVTYAIAGGVVASLYRTEIRATQDIDIIIYSSESSERLGEKILHQLQLDSHKVRKAELEGGPMFAIKNKSTPVWLLVGRKKDHIGVDFILEKVPWVEKALERSQKNKVDFGFGFVPCITVEDFIISKCYAFNNQSTRFKDLDDLISVLGKKEEMDEIYLANQIQELNIKIPDPIRNVLPKKLTHILKLKNK